jgi:TRAP-type C4-dicarboxylate transport system permease large subunit
MLTSASVPVTTRVSITELTREMPPFLLAHFVVLCLLTFIPELSTWLPHTLGFQ